MYGNVPLKRKSEDKIQADLGKKYGEDNIKVILERHMM
jgi:hypothetical protein